MPTLLLLLAAACAPPSEDEFPEAYARVICDRTQECWKAAMEENYNGDVGECVEENTDTIEAFGDDCDYDEDDAADCLEAWREESCEELFFEEQPEACREVYSDCDWFR